MLQCWLAWGKKQVTTFQVSHSGHARYVTQEGASVAPPRYTEVTVAGAPAYRQVSPSPISGSSSALSISTLAKGYVVFLTSTGLTQSQDERALASIIGHL